MAIPGLVSEYLKAAGERYLGIGIKSLIDQLVIIGLSIGLNYFGAIDAAYP